MGSEIRAARLRAGLTQQQVADLMKTRFETVSRWERGAVEPTHATYKGVLAELERVTKQGKTK